MASILNINKEDVQWPDFPCLVLNNYGLTKGFTVLEYMQKEEMSEFGKSQRSNNYISIKD